MKSSPKDVRRQSARSGSSCSINQQNQPRSSRCLKPGPIGRNPYLNFLREFRKKHCGLTAVETIRQGAKAWNVLPKEQKLEFIKEAFYAPKLKRRRRSLSRKMFAAPSRRRSKSRGSFRKSGRRMPRGNKSKQHLRRRARSC